MGGNPTVSGVVAAGWLVHSHSAVLYARDGHLSKLGVVRAGVSMAKLRVELSAEWRDGEYSPAIRGLWQEWAQGTTEMEC